MVTKGRGATGPPHGAGTWLDQARPRPRCTPLAAWAAPRCQPPLVKTEGKKKGFVFAVGVLHTPTAACESL